MAFDYRDGAGNCPPGMYRPAVGYDCRPNVSGQVLQQQNMQAIAAQYIDNGSSTNGSNTALSTTTGQQTQGYTTPTLLSQVAPATSGGGLDLTTLLIIGALALFLIKK